MNNKRHDDLLKQITGLPTAAGLEDRVIQWVDDWASSRKDVTLTRDGFGNLTVKRKGARSATPIYLTAHLDHPAFAVTDVLDNGINVQAEFRGGVYDAYFEGTPVLLHREHGRPVRGEIVSLDRKRNAELPQVVTVRLEKLVPCKPGDLMTWALPKPKIAKKLLQAPACDDLAALAAAVAAFEVMLDEPKGLGDVRLLFTRAEEVGFVGAIAAAKHETIPRRSTLICLENSKSMIDSPIGDGPIIRVGDRISVFDPDLTARMVAIAEGIQREDNSFKFQRKLMPGGACEATAFRLYGYASSCICLPLGNYHNMDDSAERIAPEFISIEDYRGMIRLLVAVGRGLRATKAQADLVDRLDRRFELSRHLLD